MTLRKTMSAVLSAIMLMSTMTGFTSAEKIRTPDTSSSPDTYTYYFLAPDNYFKTSAGAANSSVGVYWWESDEPAAWPGVEMTPAFDIGNNVFKIEGVTKEATSIIFNSFVDAGVSADPSVLEKDYQTIDINTEGYDDEYECPYDLSVHTDNFNGWIYVLDNDWNSYLAEFNGNLPVGGAWFMLDDYKNYDDYYGTYGFESTPEKSDGDNDVYNAGDIVEAAVGFGNIPDGYIGSYNYEITYNTDALEPLFDDTGSLCCESYSSSWYFVANPDDPGSVKLALAEPNGFRQDTGGAPVDIASVKFKVKKTTTDLVIEGHCYSLIIITYDDIQMSLLNSSSDNEDIYSSLRVRKISSAKTPDDPIEISNIGDLDNDGQITSADALDALRISVGIVEKTPENMALADVDSDGYVTANDALNIIRFSVGLSSVIPKKENAA